MISVTPLAPSTDTAAQRSKIIRTAVIAAVVLSVFAIAIAKLTNVTGDMLSASVLALAGLATIVAVLAPRCGARSHG